MSETIVIRFEVDYGAPDDDPGADAIHLFDDVLDDGTIQDALQEYAGDRGGDLVIQSATVSREVPGPDILALIKAGRVRFDDATAAVLFTRSEDYEAFKKIAGES